jgi:hypothetical protein
MANVISIGNNCYPAITMRNMGILKESLPFDSVGSNLLGVLRILKKKQL